MYLRLVQAQGTLKILQKFISGHPVIKNFSHSRTGAIKLFDADVSKRI